MNVIIATSGKYSDYQVTAVLEWLKPETTPEQARDLYLIQFPREAVDYRFEPRRFVAWLVREGYAQDLEAVEINTDSYGCVAAWERRPVNRSSSE